jgi:hypothetical protein
MKKLYLVAVMVLISASSFCQSNQPSVYELVNFPEDHKGETITYNNIWWFPTLSAIEDKNDNIIYYQFQLDRSWKKEEKDFGMGRMDNIMGAVTKEIARQLTTDGRSGWSDCYYGDVTGHVKEVEKYGSNYLFVITRIVYHYNNGTLIKVYE